MRARRSAPGAHWNPLLFIRNGSKDDNTWRLRAHKRDTPSFQCYGFRGNYHSVSSKECTKHNDHSGGRQRRKTDLTTCSSPPRPESQADLELLSTGRHHEG